MEYIIIIMVALTLLVLIPKVSNIPNLKSFEFANTKKKDNEYVIITLISMAGLMYFLSDLARFAFIENIINQDELKVSYFIIGFTANIVYCWAWYVSKLSKFRYITLILLLIRLTLFLYDSYNDLFK